jgi:uncharacterized protein YndB with AHSA1/START domain
VAELKSTFSWQLKAPPERVFAALTEPADLKTWFADEVEVDARVGGAFRFWGKHVYGAPKAGAQRLTRFEPGQALAFTWELHGKPSEVTLELSPGDPEKNPGGTTVAGSHVFPDGPTIARAREMVDDLWRIHNGNLAAHLAGGEGMMRPDFADPNPEVRVSTVIDAPVEKVFQAFIDPELLTRWSGAPTPVIEPRVGGAYSYGWTYEVDGRQVTSGPTHIIEYEENHKLVTDWPDWRGDPEVPVQRVTWLFDDLDGKTRVTVIHDGFVRAVDISDYPFGWAGFGGMLRSIFEPAAA